MNFPGISRKRTAVMAVLFVGSLSVLAGCGGDDPPPATLKDDFIAAADALCAKDTKYTQQVAGDYFAALAQEDYAAAAAVVLDLQTREAATIDQIEDLKHPEEDQATVERFVDLSRQMNELDSQIADALEAEDTDAVNQLNLEADELNEERNLVADGYGFTACGSEGYDPGTTTGTSGATGATGTT